MYFNYESDKTVSMSGVVRDLVDMHGLRVIVDCSPNSMDDLLLKSGREDIFEIESMTRDMISIIPQFQELHAVIKQADLADAVWKILGGIPLRYERLRVKLAKYFLIHL